MASKKKKRPTPPAPPVTSKPTRAQTRPEGPTKRELERAAAAKAARKETLRRRLITGGLVLAAVAAVGGYVVTQQRAEGELREALTSGSCDVDTESDPTRPTGQNHVPAPVFGVNPPAGGDHLAGVSRSGVYAGAQVPADGLLVHALEHGYVIAWHKPGLPKEQLDLMTAFEQRHDGDVVVAERADMPTPFAATAWGRRLLCGAVEEKPLERFFEEYVDQGPEDVPRV